MTALTTRALNRATLARQSLLDRRATDVVSAVSNAVALQAQEAASPYLALWNRVERFDPRELDAAFADRRVVKSTMMRITLHAVAAADHPRFRAAMLPSIRAARLHDRRYRDTGLTVDDAERLADVVVAHAHAPRTTAEMEAVLDGHVGDASPKWAFWGIRQCAPLIHAPDETRPWSFGRRPRYVAEPTGQSQLDHLDGLAHLVRRYLGGFGPATVPDVARFTLLSRSVVREVLASMGGEVNRVAGPDGAELFDLAATTGAPPIPDEDVPAPPRLLGMWDSVLLAYADRSRVVPDAHRAQVVRRNGDCLATVLVDGQVRGVWRATGSGIEVTPFESLDDDTLGALDAEAAALRSFLADRDPRVYSRYDRWWSELDALPAIVLGT